MLAKLLGGIRGLRSYALCDGNAGAHAAGKKSKAPPLPSDCEDIVCRSKMDMMQQAFKSMQQQPHQPFAPVVPAKPKVECPVDKDELGRAAWALMHTTAAYFPEDPEFEEQLAAMSLMLGLSKLYPCSYCQADFEAFRKASPPDVSSREAFAKWVCELHNSVNTKLGKPTFPCEIEKLDERWRTGAPECNAASEPAAHDSLGQPE